MRASLAFSLVALLLPQAASSQPKLPTEENFSPRKMLTAYLLAEAQKHFDARRAEVAELKTPDDVRHRQWKLRTRMIAALGGFPEKTPLNAKTVGKAQRDGYRIEKVIYESRPNHHVTATLYLPDGSGPFPGCIMPIGHSLNGKAADYIQRGSILLAKNGIACLAYDPIGQGERRQLLDDASKSLIPSSTNEHTLIGVGALLIGQGTATFRVWDGIRSLDYLESRPEIDPKKLGCTGCSGGGTLTSYLMALDDRIACAAPSCYITSLERLFATIGPQDAEQNITGQVALGIEHADYLTMRAPRPTLLATATQDFFDIKGSWTTFREATQIYGLMGHSERVSLVEYNTKHGYPKPQREAVTRWMSRWLLEKDVPIVELPFAIAKDADLQCTRSGQVLEDLKGKSAFHIIAEYEQQFAKERAAKLAKQSPEQTRAEVRRLLGLPDETGKLPATPASSSLNVAYSKDGLSYGITTYHVEPGIHVSAMHMGVGKKGAPLIVYLNGLGASADWPALKQLVAAGNHVVALDPRGIGETSPGKLSEKPSYFGTDFKESFLALHLNRPLLGQRVSDVLLVINSLRGRGQKIHIIGVHGAGPIALHAAALEPAIESVTLEQSLISWSAVTRSPINYNQLTNVVPGALKSYDLPDLATLIAPRPLTIRNAWDPKWQPVTQAVLEETYATSAKAYAKSGGKLTLVAAR
jgi:cephalosporin-C deacetylase-like acetyl esterase